MTQFIVYSLCGFCEVWLIFFMWGFSNGPTNAIPFFAAIGSLVLFIAAAPAALFMPRLAAGFVLATVALMLPWPSFILMREGSVSGFGFCGVAPLVAGAVAGWHLWRTRSTSWFTTLSRPRLVLRVPLAILPVVIFVSTFSARLIVALLLQGPSR